MTAKRPGRTAPHVAASTMARGVTWAVMMRWVMRLIGLVSTLLLARLLTPADFGVAAMGMMVVYLLSELTEFGTSMHLIRAKTIDRQHCDTAWTITLLQGVLTALALVALAYPASLYYDEPRIVSVMYVLAAAALVGGFENIGPVLMRRDLEFAKDFRFNVYKKLLVFATTVSSALLLRNYWALVLGHLAGSIAAVVLSYLVHPYRPRWSLGHAGEYLRFSLAVIPLRLAVTLREMLPSFLIAGAASASVVGAYRVAGDLSRMFTKEIVTPMGRGLLPMYSRLADQPEQLSAMYRKVLSMVALLCIPAGVGTSAVAVDLTAVLLGSQWGFAAELMKYMGLGAAVFAVSQAMVNQILVATGREKSAAMLAWIRLAITAPILYAGLHLGGAVGLAQAAIVAAVLCLPVIFNETRRAVTLPPSALAGLLWRPTLASGALFVAARGVAALQMPWPLARLLLSVAAGALAFAVVLWLAWRLAGRPDGAERIALSGLRTLRQRLKGRMAGRGDDAGGAQ